MATLCLTNGTAYAGVTAFPGSSVIIRDGRIVDVVGQSRLSKTELPADTVIVDVEGGNIAPGFIDTHIHGLHGFDTSDRSTEAILEISRILPRYGVTSFCPTIYPQAPDDFLASVQAASAAIGKESGARILGLHIEGPFISVQKKGVQRPEHISPVDLDLMERIDTASNGAIAIMTVAPELKNMRELALLCAKKGIVLSAGHSDASYENMLEGMQVGILHSTHFFNAMRGLHHRDPGVAGAIMIHPDISCEVIADGFHVHPAILSHLLRVKPLDNIVLVTDSLRPTGQIEGRLEANQEEVYLKDDVFYRKTDDVIAGSSLTMIKGVQNLVSFGVPLEDALRMAAANPARVLNQQTEIGSLIPGRKADLVVFDNDFEVRMTMVGGEPKWGDLQPDEGSPA